MRDMRPGGPRGERAMGAKGLKIAEGASGTGGEGATGAMGATGPRGEMGDRETGGERYARRGTRGAEGAKRPFGAQTPRRPVVAIVQARMSSTRLPGKVMREICGRPMLWHVINRLRYVRAIDEIVVATSTHSSDDIISRWCSSEGVASYRGALSDVLSRYHGAAKEHGARTVVRVTADCPMIDPILVERVVEEFLNAPDLDYMGLDGTFPDGLDTEVFTFHALDRAFKEAILPSEREHVTPHIWKNRQRFRVRSIPNIEDLSHMRWTVDDGRDLEFARKVFQSFACPLRVFYMEEILELIDRIPELLKINSSTIRNEGYLRSLAGDMPFSGLPHR